MKFLPSHQPLPAGTPVWSNTEDVLAQGEAVQQLPAIALHFPKWTDGRAYSQAVLLRLRLRWRGELIATGEVLADMLPLLRRCGFTAVQLRADQSLEAAQRALGWFDGHSEPSAEPYQRAPGDAPPQNATPRPA
jgi:uncharacterized protein (DUF934 family)